MNAGFVPHTMTREELLELLHRANRAYYMRPRYLLHKLWKMRSVEDVRQNLRGFLAFSRAGEGGESADCPPG